MNNCPECGTPMKLADETFPIGSYVCPNCKYTTNYAPPEEDESSIPLNDGERYAE